MKARIWISVAALAFVCFGAVPARAELAAGLRYAMQLNLDAYNRKNVDATMGTIDSHSPDYASTKTAIEEQFKGGDVTGPRQSHRQSLYARVSRR